MLLQTFYEDFTNSPGIEVHKRIRIHYGLWMELLVSAFLCI